MQVITPKQTTVASGKSSKPKKKGTLAPLKSTAPSASATTYSFPKPAIDASEKQKLKLLAQNPMKLDQLQTALQGDAQQIDDEVRAREERRQRLQEKVEQLLSKRTDDGELLVDMQSVSGLSAVESTASVPPESLASDSSSSDDLGELSQSSTFLESIDSAVSARAATRERIQAATDALLQKVDEDGNKLVEMPANHEEILSMLYELQSVDRSDVPTNCIEVYEQTKAIINQNEKNKEGWAKIRELDRIIDAKEREVRAIESRNPSVFSASSSIDRPTFVTHYRRVESTASQPEKIRKNIELASNPAAKYYLTERLQKKEKERLLELESDSDLRPTKYEAEMQKLAFVDERLKHFVPPERWEERSIQSYPTNLHQASESSFTTTRSQLTAPTILMDAKPGERELQAQKEQREARQRLSAINDSLDELRQKPLAPASQFEIQKLLSDVDDTLISSNDFIRALCAAERESALSTAKSLLSKLETSLRDDDETEAIMHEAETAMQKYQVLSEIEQEETARDPALLAEQERLQSLLLAYNEKEREIESVMKSLDELEERTQRELRELQVEEARIQVPLAVVEEQSIEDFEKLIEKRAKSRVQVPDPTPLLTAAEFPLTLQLLAEKASEDEAD